MGSLLVKSLRTFALGVNQSPTRAKASAIRVSSSSAKKARRSKDSSDGKQQKTTVSETPPARSEQNISAQLIDDVNGVTLASASSLEKDLGVVGKNNVEAAAKVGTAIADRAIKAGVTEAYFDRGGFLFHGK